MSLLILAKRISMLGWLPLLSRVKQERIVASTYKHIETATSSPYEGQPTLGGSNVHPLFFD